MRWLLLLLFVLAAPLVAAPQSVNLTIVETGNIVNYLNTYWVVQVNGTGTIHNPSNFDLFDVRLNFDLLTLQLIDNGGDGTFSGNALRFESVPAGGSATFSYTIQGITVQPPTLTDRGVMYTAFSKRTPRIYSDTFGSLQKAPIEDPTITGRSNHRLISVTLQNPTTLQLTVESMRVLKTPQLNPNNQLDVWDIVNTTSPRVLSADGFLVHDILDSNATEGEVYWLQSEVYISDVNLLDNNTLTRYSDENITAPIEALNFTNFTSRGNRSYLTPSYLLRKSIDRTIAVPGAPVEVTLTLYNLGPQLQPYTITDTLPAGFSASKSLFDSGQVRGRGSIVYQYDAVLEDTQAAGIDVFPAAQAVVGGRTIFSPEVTFIRQFLPADRVYLQKRVTYRDEDYVEVEISVQNLGQQPLVDATLKDLLTEDDLFSEISVVPESKGVWQLPSIDVDETWQVTYVTEPGDSMTALPILYGVPSGSVLRTIVLENIVREAWQFVRTNILEFTGILLIVAVPLLLFLNNRYGWLNRR